MRLVTFISDALGSQDIPKVTWPPLMAGPRGKSRGLEQGDWHPGHSWSGWALAQSSTQGPTSLSFSWINRARRAGVHLCRPVAQARTHPSKEGLAWAGPQIDLAVGILSGCAGGTAQGQAVQKLRAAREAPAVGETTDRLARGRQRVWHTQLAGLSLQSSPQNHLVRTSGGWTLLPGRAGCSNGSRAPEGPPQHGLMFREAFKD